MPMIKASTVASGHLLFLTVTLAFLVVALVGSAVLAAPPELKLAYPWKDGQQLEADSVFAFGAVTPGSVVTVNGVDALVNDEVGTFLAVVPVKTGESTDIVITATNKDGETTTLTRPVLYPGVWTTSPTSPVTIDLDKTQPAEDLTLEPGDELRVFVKGSPGATASFSIGDFRKDLPLVEQPNYVGYYWGEGRFGTGANTTTVLDVKGAYVGSYVVQPGDNVEKAPINITLTMPDGTAATATAKGAVTLRTSPVPVVGEINNAISGWMYATRGDTQSGRIFDSFGGAYPAAPIGYPPVGTKVQIVGEAGGDYKVRLAPGFDVFVAKKGVTLLPAGTPLPFTEIPALKTVDLPDRVQVRLSTNERVPFLVEQRVNPNALAFTLYGAVNASDSIFQDTWAKLIKAIRVDQVGTRVARLTIDLNQPQQMGYKYYYDKNELVIEIRKSPLPSQASTSPVAGRTILVDPGHGGPSDKGGTGPTGIHEKVVDLGIAKKLQALLEKAGAKVIMSRADDVAVGITTRAMLGVDNNVDLFISVHNNAFPDGIDTTKLHGHSVLYNHPMDEKLAKILQQSLIEEVGFQDYGVFFRGNLGVIRRWEMPSVLVEVGFMMYPDEIAVLLSEDGQQRIAEALFHGIEKFFREATGVDEGGAGGQN